LFSRVPVFAAVAATVQEPTSSQQRGDGNSLGVEKTSYRSNALSPDSVALHIELARWCRKENLVDEERAHWTQVLLNDPDNREAQDRLHLRWFMGRLLTDSQLEAAKRHRALEEKQLKQWAPVVLRWQKALDRGSPSEKDRATSEMSSVTDPAIIPALEQIIGAESPKPSAKSDSITPFERHAIALLGRLPQQRATYSLAVHAVLGRQAEARCAAIAELKKRPLHDFVPLLLDQLANPIEFSYVAARDTTGGFATYRSIARQEGPDSIKETEESAIVSGLSPVTVVISGALRARTLHSRWACRSCPIGHSTLGQSRRCSLRARVMRPPSTGRILTSS
jgi:hypothetical protein